MYAVLLDLDTNCLNGNYEGIIKKYMLSNGFEWKQGSVYFGGETINAVNCVIIIQKLAKLYPWFSTCVFDK